MLKNEYFDIKLILKKLYSLGCRNLLVEGGNYLSKSIIKNNMFNGIIFNQGVIKKITKRDKGINIFINSNLKLTKKDIGVSVSCDGVCLTLITIINKLMEFYLSDETIQRSKFKFLKIKDKINLELPLK